MAAINASLLAIISDSKLTGPNYVDWYRSIKLLITAKGLVSVLDEDPPEEPLSVDDPAYIEIYQDFIVRDSKASLYIQGSTDKSLVESIKDIRTVGGKMAKLVELFNRQLTHANYDMVSQIHNTRMSQGTPVMDHVMKMINLFEKLETMGTTFDLLYKKNVILNSVLGSYAPFSDVIQNQ
ncbi:uncharacterized protein LOC122662917 [Telopea speciosissima]|uniref:uncharacterized protein LOC122662917 n=1 Tax=Telopea speciosissima TaxID=54955 RepID=UPI001CC61C9F|nr:uncharacterized protein LOC122662917 [Telopea speciosissima]